MNGKHQLFLFGIVIAIGGIIATYLVTDVIRDVRMSHQIIKVRGYAEKNVTSDLVVWGITVKTRTKDIIEGYKVIESNQQEILSFLKQNKIADKEIKMSSVTMQEKMKKVGYEKTNELDYYLMSQRFEIVSKNVSLISDLSTKIDVLIKKGIEIHSENPNYYYSKVNDLKSELLTDATKDARNRARTLAEGSGVKLGFLRAARQGRFSIRSAKATNISSERSYDDESSIEKKIIAVVTVDYSMK